MFDVAAFDLDAYLGRIRYGGPTDATHRTLAAIALAHPIALPFENLDPLLRRPVALDIASLQRKLIRDGRGGYCFEHNLLLGTALTALRFDVTGLAARVMWNNPPGAITPRGHMLLLLQLDGHPHIVDAGFGGLTLTAPLRLEADVEQETPHERFRLQRDGDAFLVQARIRDEWKSLYRFDLQRQALADYEVTSWYLSNHPRSHFVTGLIAARAESDRRYGLRNTELAIHHLGGSTERRLLTDGRDIRTALADFFRIQLPDGPEVDAAFTRLTASVLPT
jgi:N-hydroxyarylamine O-acetyltransferase